MTIQGILRREGKWPPVGMWRNWTGEIKDKTFPGPLYIPPNISAITITNCTFRGKQS